MSTADWYTHPPARSWTCPPAPREAAAFHATLPGHAPTPLREVPALADELGVRRVFVKDESSRLGLPAFKILGASWAIHRALAETSGDRLVTATDGNHGRAVARIARLLGLAAHVLVPGAVHPAAAAAIEREGARVTRVGCSYDDAVHLAAETAAREPAAVLVQDTSRPGYTQIPEWITEGYTTLFHEADAQLRALGAEPAGLVAIPVGVGSLAQAAVTHYRAPRNAPAPSLLSVEPDSAACVLASLTASRPTTVPTGTTVMTGLNCGTPSSAAWPRLRDGLDGATAVTDADSLRAARDLAALGISSGPCGAAALAGARAALTSSAERRAALAEHSTGTVVLLNTEGADANPHTSTHP
ncbi:pyridoxal-phosphate dependent enzyme [Streptomyces halobius]|uniref:Pyridoxal-phosphate dependent enzyme n=1 Tax=Streptomyces halobius TaxID=2879846 RepID=A0ABY4LYY1_9ACTN|nr:pyridoxal-phosphate dependent enzyme [Streptomyces halobius]UQA90675.1 pyridoxal-phosphate dependent enzyme [Streptomyces halobius]